MHLTACWCWAKTFPETIAVHTRNHEAHDIVERLNIERIALEVATWPNKKLIFPNNEERDQ